MRRSTITIAGLALVALVAAVPERALAQAGGTPAPSPPAVRPGVTPRLPPGPLGIQGSSDLIATSSSNEHGSYLWIVGPLEHVVVLCQKATAEKDFTCVSKSMP